MAISMASASRIKAINWLGRASPRMLDGVVAVCTAFDQARSKLAELRQRPPKSDAAAH